MGNRIKFKVEELFESELGISDIENGERKTLKLGKKVSKDIFRTGSIYEGLVSGEWLNFVFENIVAETPEINPLDYSEIIENAMMEKPISLDQFKIAIKELLPEYSFGLDQSCMSMSNDLKNIIIEHNKRNFVPRMTVYYNEIKEHEKCIMFFDLDPVINNYSSKIISIEGYVVYFKF